MKTKMVLKPNTYQTVSTSRRTVVIFSTFGLFGLMLASFFIFDLREMSHFKKTGPLLLKNASFEKWRKNSPVGWTNTGAIVSIKENDFIHGNLAVRIYNKSKERKGITQEVKLNPNEVYNIRFTIKSDNLDQSSTGVEITYSGDDIRTTTDASQGIHYHAKGPQWTQYFGRVTGARSVTLFFFSRNNHALSVDAVGIGVNVMPANMIQNNLSSNN